MSERVYRPEQWIPEIPADAAEFLDGEPPVRLEDLPEKDRKAAEAQLASRTSE